MMIINCIVCGSLLKMRTPTELGNYNFYCNNKDFLIRRTWSHFVTSEDQYTANISKYSISYKINDQILLVEILDEDIIFNQDNLIASINASYDDYVKLVIKYKNLLIFS